MTRRRSVAVAAAIALLALPAIALAAVNLSDRQGDGGAKLDIASVAVYRTGDGMYRHVITTYGAFSAADLVTAKGPPNALCFLIWTRRHAGEARPDYQLCAAPTADGRRLRGTLARLPRAGVPKRVHFVEVDRPSDRSIALEVLPKDLGKPKSYRFVAQTQEGGAGCDRYTRCADFSPERPSVPRFKP